jgi:TatD DNase family protein
VVAIGEIGLDYDRTQFCSKEVQMEWFHRQLELARDTSLPVIFHNRNTDGDFERVVREKREMFTKGIVHSFTGDVEEMNSLVGLGLHIGINGCALKTEEGLAMATQIPLNRQVCRMPRLLVHYHHFAPPRHGMPPS